MSDTLASILKQAEAHGILQRKVVKGGETEYLPTHPGEASTANKWSPNQPRDEMGRFGGGSGASSSASANAEALHSFVHAGLSGDQWEAYEQAENQAIDGLTEKLGIPREDTEVLVRTWANMSPDDMGYLSLHQSASEAFDLPVSEYIDGRIQTMDQRASRIMQTRGITKEQLPEQYLPAFDKSQQRSMLEGMYSHTQEELGKAGIDENATIRLTRGVKLSPEQAKGLREGDSVEFKGNVMESWTTDQHISSGYGMGGAGEVGIVLEMEVPRTQILSTPKTGFGMANQSEIIVLDNRSGAKARVVKVTR